MPPSFLLTNGIALSIALAIVGLVVALILIRKIVGADAGNEKMASHRQRDPAGCQGLPEPPDLCRQPHRRGHLCRGLVSA
jgi:hypothetical protein